MTHRPFITAVKVHFQVGGYGPASFVRSAQGPQDESAVQRRRTFGAEGWNQAGTTLPGIGYRAKRISLLRTSLMQ